MSIWITQSDKRTIGNKIKEPTIIAIIIGQYKKKRSKKQNNNKINK